MFVIRMTVPTSLANGGQLRFVELVDQPAPRQLTLSTQPCDFRGFVPGSYSPIDPTGGTYPMWRVNGQTLSLDYRLGTNPFNYPILQPGQTYYFNVRNVNWVNGAPSCGGATCNGRFESQAN
jgi:hypothetical protein